MLLTTGFGSLINLQIRIKGNFSLIFILFVCLHYIGLNIKGIRFEY